MKLRINTQRQSTGEFISDVDDDDGVEFLCKKSPCDKSSPYQINKVYLSSAYEFEQPEMILHYNL